MKKSNVSFKFLIKVYQHKIQFKNSKKNIKALFTDFNMQLFKKNHRQQKEIEQLKKTVQIQRDDLFNKEYLTKVHEDKLEKLKRENERQKIVVEQYPHLMSNFKL